MKLFYTLGLCCFTFVFCNAQIKSVESIKTFIDSLYQISSPFRFDSITDFSSLKAESGHNVGLMRLHKQHLQKYYSYISFNFYFFKTGREASRIFDSLILISKEEPSDFSEGPAFYEAFPKGGSTYILYQNMIVMHLRRCNYMPIDNTREDTFIKFLFDNNLPRYKYFLQVGCGWDHPKVK